MKKLFLIVIWVGFCFSLPTNAEHETVTTDDGRKLPLSHEVLEIFPNIHAFISSEIITGNYKSRDGEEFHFTIDQTFTYKLYAKDSLHDGAYEGSSCAVTNRKTGKVLHQGNFMFYFNGTSCCYNVKLVGKKLLVLSRIWTKDYNENLCPNTNLRFVPKK